MKVVRRGKTEGHLVTDARRPMSEDISYRERRYLIQMAIRTVCLVLAVVLHGYGGPWWVIALAAAIALPYFAVVFANGGREPESMPPLPESNVGKPSPSALPPKRHEIST